MSELSKHIPAYRTRWRYAKDRLATVGITAGGAGVLLAILLIFFYLLYEVLPLFRGADVQADGSAPWSTGGATAYLAVEEQGVIGLAMQSNGSARFFRVDSGETVGEAAPVPEGAGVTVIAPEAPEKRLLGLGRADGSVILRRHDYKLSYPGGEQVITPSLAPRHAELDIRLGRGPVRALAISDGDDALVVAGEIADTGLRALRFVRQENFLTGETTVERERLRFPTLGGVTGALYIGASQRWLYRLEPTGAYTVIDLQAASGEGAQPVAAAGQLFEGGGRLTASTMLLGGISLLAASDRGELVQYFMVRDEQGGHRFQRVRSFDTDGAVVTQLLPEHRRKGFLALGREGELQIYHTTAHRRLYSEALATGRPQVAAIAPRGDALVAIGPDRRLHHWSVHNEHPDISWSALWDEVWYESYDEPDHIWQSSAANNDFEPKYSFAPLAFGTLKAAFYTMLIAAPLAICGAIYTAYFMAPGLRRKVKPMIELMEALPTVILGFLAGLWLAPFVEDKLAGLLVLLLAMPVGIVLFAFAWSRLPLALRRHVPEGWDAAVLVPVVLLIGFLCFSGNDALELALFGGDMRLWLTRELGISFDQRNSLVVGVAMGMAVIPTIFSIAEDAIFSVPRHLSDGSLALGATPWQTLVGVVLPTASPGIFSGLMIGLGRAVGETMIVLMATGNTPIMDANIFEGMRTLSANIAVEVPEAEVDSTHFRVLFLAAFVLFLFTFVVNTVAELVRQRLRLKYGSL